MKHICKNCGLYNPIKGTCAVQLIILGEVMRDIPVDPNDKCLWEEYGLDDQIKEIKFTSVDPVTGKPTAEVGKIRVEYPADLFND